MQTKNGEFEAALAITCEHYKLAEARSARPQGAP
jgi:hypothetical protein